MSRPRRLVASAPSRIDLAGGTLDIWPISVMVPDACTVNVAIDLPARAEVGPAADDRVRIVSRDRRRRLTRRLPLARVPSPGPLSLLERLLASFEPQVPLELTTLARAPAGAGLGGSSTLAVAVTAVLARYLGEPLGRERLLRRVLNVEAAEIGVPTGLQDYLAAVFGGLAAYHHGPDGPEREPLAVPGDLEARMVLAYTGRPRRSGLSNWELYRRFLERDAVTVRRMHEIARIALGVRDALAAGDVDRVGELVGEEGKLRYRLGKSVATPELRRAGTAARRAGALGVKVCGAGGGGCLVAIARRGRERQVARAVERTGATLLPVRVARTGVRVASVIPQTALDGPRGHSSERSAGS